MTARDGSVTDATSGDSGASLLSLATKDFMLGRQFALGMAGGKWCRQRKMYIVSLVMFYILVCIDGDGKHPHTLLDLSMVFLWLHRDRSVYLCIYPSWSGLLISYLNIWLGGGLPDPDSHVLIIPVHINWSYADRYLVWSISTPPFKSSPFPFWIYVVCVLGAARLL